jgi:hypothetical protein
MRSFRLIAARFLAALLTIGSIGGAITPLTPRHGVEAEAVSAPSLSSLLLSASDIKRAFGSGFHVLLSRATTNSELRKTFGSKGTTALPGLTGRVSGYESMYTHQLMTVKGAKVTAKPGISLVLSGVNEYQNTGFAHRAISLTEHSKAKLPKGTTEHVAPLPGIGDSGAILSVHTVVAGIPPTDSVYIGFQRDKYTAIVDVAAYGGKPNGNTILWLARLMDARIRSKG